MGSPRVDVPELKAGGLRPYLPALQYGIQALRYREAELLDRFEVAGFRDARDARRELEELVEIVEREM